MVSDRVFDLLVAFGRSRTLPDLESAFRAVEEFVSVDQDKGRRFGFELLVSAAQNGFVGEPVLAALMGCLVGTAPDQNVLRAIAFVHFARGDLAGAAEFQRQSLALPDLMYEGDASFIAKLEMGRKPRGKE